MASYNAKFKLSYHAGSGTWTKFYMGKNRYILRGAKDQATYRLASAKWIVMKAELDGVAVVVADAVATTAAAVLPAAATWPRAFILLALNCGYTQTDISGLTWDMITENGVVDTLRSKTARHGCRQRHQLWKITQTVLAECQKAGVASSSGTVFTDGKGGTMKKESMAGKYSKTDCVKNAFFRLQKMTGVKGSFKLFRKTGASVLETCVLSGAQKYVTDLYLAHSAKGMKRFYTDADFRQLDAALGKMEAHFNFAAHVGKMDQAAA